MRSSLSSLAATAFVAAFIVGCRDEAPAAPAPLGASDASSSSAAGSASAAAVAASHAAAHAGLPPTERLLRVTAAAGPLMDKPSKTKPALHVVHPGDLVRPGAPVDPGWSSLVWQGVVDGVKTKRSGRVVEVRRAAGDGRFFGFAEDFGDEIEVPSSAWLCDAMERVHGAPFDDCAGRLRYVALPDGRILAYVPYTSGPCPIAIAGPNGGDIGLVLVDGVMDARLVSIASVSTGASASTGANAGAAASAGAGTSAGASAGTDAGTGADAAAGGGAKSVLLAFVRRVDHDGRLTSGRIVSLAVDGKAPEVRSEIVVDEVDARGEDVVVSRIARADVTPPSVRISGDRREVARKTGRELSASPIDETYRIGADGRFERTARAPGSPQRGG